MLTAVIVGTVLASGFGLATRVSEERGEKPTMETYSFTNSLVNGDFEMGMLEGWDVGGNCTISSTIVLNGSYSAYISAYDYGSIYYDNGIGQFLYPYTHLPVDFGLTLEAWIYPLSVGSIGGQYPFSGIVLRFYNESSMEEEFEIYYTWCYTSSWPPANDTDTVVFLLPSFNVSSWNALFRNVADDFYSYFGSDDYSTIVLHSIKFISHYSSESPGAFYADDLKLSIDLEAQVEIHDVYWLPTSPPPYVPSGEVRVDEPVLVEANVSGPNVEHVLLKFRRQDGQWFNVTMVFNETARLWVQTIQGQSDNCTVELFIEVLDAYGRSLESSLYSFNVKALLVGDVDGDGGVDIFDLVRVAGNYGERLP